MPRMVTLALIRPSGAVLGALAPFTVPTPWRQEVGEVVAAARDRFGLDVTVLRLLAADGDEVTYLAECPVGEPVPPGSGRLTADSASLRPLAAAVPPGSGRLTADSASLRPLAVAVTDLRPIEVDDTPQPCRAPYAEVGGPAASLAWATGVLGPVTATQLRTWNLSSIWRLEHRTGTAWLKEVPAFFAHEGAVIGWLAARYPGFGPQPLAVDGGRVLLADIPGEDRYAAGAGERLDMLRALHEVQRRARPAELSALGVPVVGCAELASRIQATVLRYGDPEMLDGLADRLAALDACGLPGTLVHGDFHPGNVRGSVVLDWSDSFVGHPAFDLYRMLEPLPADEAGPIVAHWCRWWRAAVPGCDPETAFALLEPVAALRNATVYANFLDRIEPAEHSYHAADVPDWLDRASRALHAVRR